jgi:hypothetical protein
MMIESRGNPVTHYVGIFDEHGYRVLADAEPLKLHHHYADHRNWHTDNGLRQLALDLLIDTLEEPIANDGLVRRSKYRATDYADLAAAWLPHLHYAAQLWPVARSKEYSRWELSDRQILAWLWDWMYERHLRTAKPRYCYYGGMAFADWSATFTELMTRFGVVDLSTIGLGRPAQFKYYLTGYLPHDIVILWCQNLLRIKQRQGSGRLIGKPESAGH